MINSWAVKTVLAWWSDSTIYIILKTFSTIGIYNIKITRNKIDETKIVLTITVLGTKPLRF